MDENHNQNVKNWKNSWKDNWKGHYQSTDDGYQFEGYGEDNTPHNFKELQSGLQSKDPIVQKKTLMVMLTGLATIIIVIAVIFLSMDIGLTD